MLYCSRQHAQSCHAHRPGRGHLCRPALLGRVPLCLLNSLARGGGDWAAPCWPTHTWAPNGALPLMRWRLMRLRLKGVGLLRQAAETVPCVPLPDVPSPPSPPCLLAHVPPQTWPASEAGAALQALLWTTGAPHWRHLRGRQCGAVLGVAAAAGLTCLLCRRCPCAVVRLYTGGTLH